MEPPIFLTALLLLSKGCEVLTQRGEYTKQFSPTLCATSYLSPTGQFSIPAIIKPIFPTVEPTCAPEIVPSYPDYGSNPCTPQSTPPIIITRDNDDDWCRLLYFLILALSKNRGGGDCGCSNGNGGFGGNFGYGGNGFGGNGCGGNAFGGNGHGGYDCNGGYGCDEVGDYDNFANYGGKDTVYVPYPIAVPINFPSCFPWFSNPDNISPKPDICPSPESEAPPCNCECNDPNGVSVIIRTVE